MRSADELELLRAILAADEDDDEPRLVYADYLMDRGDPRGELIVVQCRDETDVLEDRALNLFDEGAARWLGAWHGETNNWRFRRGFLHHLAVPIDTFVTLGAMLFETDPYPDELVHLRSLELRPAREAHIDIGDIVPGVNALLERLQLTSLKLDLPLSFELVRQLSPRAFAQLTSLSVPHGPDAARFVTKFFPKRLDTLALGTLAEYEATNLADDARYSQIRHLIASTESEASAIALITKQLTSLHLTCYGMSTAILDTLARARPPLVDLSLYRIWNADSFVPLGVLSTLERLDLRGASLDDGGLDTVLSLPHLTTLNIAHTRVTPAGVVRIYREAPPTLRELTLTTPRLSDDLVARLHGRFTLHRWH
jgi:uncharacterized protein (TIGR02996 family)